jgi:hypothetical protein
MYLYIGSRQDVDIFNMGKSYMYNMPYLYRGCYCPVYADRNMEERGIHIYMYLCINIYMNIIYECMDINK